MDLGESCFKESKYWYISVMAFFLLPYQAVVAESADDYNNCILEKVSNSDEKITVEKIKAECRKLNSNITILKETIEPTLTKNAAKKAKNDRTRTILTHKPNYILPATYNRSGYDATLYQQQFNNSGVTLDSNEAQFQVSVKVPLLVDIFNENISIYGAYTNRSFWQLYNNNLSSPFRETNHEPEIWLEIKNNQSIWGFKNTLNQVGFVHHSNGRGGLLSRSWNRIFANFMFEKKSMLIELKAWGRIKEDISDDDNPDITDYYGHSELRFAYKLKRHTFSLMSRNNLESGFEKGAVELGWSFPLGRNSDLKGYVHIFSGYGDSLIDYNKSVNKIGIGLVLADWL